MMFNDAEKGWPVPISQTSRRKPLGQLLITAIVFAYIIKFAPYHSLLQHCGWEAQAPAPKGPIDWEECGKGFECGYLKAPLDYRNASAGNVTLAVGRYLATSKDRLGSVFVNPGGRKITSCSLE